MTHLKFKESIEHLVVRATENFTKIVSINEIKDKYMDLYWGGNGAGDRWANKRFNYTFIYSTKKTALYSENYDDIIPLETLNTFLQKNEFVGRAGIIGIFVHSKRTNKQQRPINNYISKQIKSLSCVVCGTRDTICDHKNDLYNDERVLSTKTQLISDFQPLCNHCNLQKRQICKTEEKNEKLFSAKNIQSYKSYEIEFPWEKKTYDKNDINCKNETYWFDPVQFNKNINLYLLYVYPIIKEIKHKIKINKLKLIT